MAQPAYFKPHCDAVKPLIAHFNCFLRNGVWGSCSDCPRIGPFNDYMPEFCEHFNRADHKLTLESLTEKYNMELSWHILHP